MRKLFLFILILPFVSWAQVDSLGLKIKSQEIKIVSCDKNIFPTDAIYVIDGIYITDNSFEKINSNEIKSINIIKETSEILPHLRKPLVIIKTKKIPSRIRC